MLSHVGGYAPSNQGWCVYFRWCCIQFNSIQLNWIGLDCSRAELVRNRGEYRFSTHYRLQGISPKNIYNSIIFAIRFVYTEGIGHAGMHACMMHDASFNMFSVRTLAFIEFIHWINGSSPEIIEFIGFTGTH